MKRRTFLQLLTGGAIGGLIPISGCASSNWNILGYSTQGNYDNSISTIYVPILQNKAFQTTPAREMEMELTRAIIREIESKTPYKVLSDAERADTELLGTVVRYDKILVNRNQQNEVREFELHLTVELVWRDLRTGKVLSNRRSRQADLAGANFDNSRPIPEPGPEKAIPLLVSATGRGLPEAGETNASAQKMVIDRLANRVVELMEKPWELEPRECPR